jgi:nanoRNase/pAp phosphatase (c-di-AMP/oligoRNAs hydrolase)
MLDVEHKSTYLNWNAKRASHVSLIAKAYGGGGHRNASGFRLPHGVSP